MISFLLKREPRSYNAKSRHKYQADIKKEFDKLNIKEPLTDILYTRVYYFHKKKTSIDADNLSKPIHDALNGDDNLVKYRVCSTIDLRKNEITEIDLSNMSSGSYIEFYNAIATEENVVYIEIGKFNNKIIELGSEINDTI